MAMEEARLASLKLQEEEEERKRMCVGFIIMKYEIINLFHSMEEDHVRALQQQMEEMKLREEEVRE